MPRKNDRPAPRAPVPEDPPEAAGDLTEGQDAPLPEEGAPLVIEDEEIVGLSEEDEYLTNLWYGPQGSGKTTHLSRVLLHEPVGNLIVCNAEGGMKMRALRERGIPIERIRVWPKPGVRPTFDALERLVFKIDADLAAARRAGEPRPWCAFGIDSITELVKLMLDNVSEDQIAGQREIDRKARAAGVTPPRRNQRARFKAERDDYGLVSGQMRSILRRLRYMDLHFLITALVRRDEDEDTGATMYGPAMPPALQQDLLGYVDVVVRTEVRKEGERELFVGHTRPDENHHGKDRYGVLPRELEDPGADRILGIITGRPEATPPQEEPPPPAPADETETAPVEEAPAKKAPARRRKTAAATIDKTATTVTVDGTAGSDDDPPF